MTMVGQYEIRELLGAGGIGQVHAAFDTDLQREVALKSLRSELLSDTSFIEQFRGEAKNLARLSHPNITTIYTVLSEGGNFYLVMECVRGETLEDLLKKRGGRISVKESLAIISQIADGLSYAHSKAVIHRDIKPANVMITPAGVVKIMDFGIARVRGSQRLTRAGSIVGTLEYMSPEQLRDQEADERSDLYSTAIMLYEMISGSVPFQAATDFDLMQAHVKAQPPRLSSRVSGIDSRLEAALMRALAKKPEQRFASLREFSDALGASVLRSDASQIVHDGTRLIDAPSLAPLVPASMSIPMLDRLTFIPPELRKFAALGAGGVVLVGLAMAVIVILTPAPAPAPSVSAVSSSSSAKAVVSSLASASSRSAAVSEQDASSAPGNHATQPLAQSTGRVQAKPPMQQQTTVALAGPAALPDLDSPPHPPAAAGDPVRRGPAASGEFAAGAPAVAALSPQDGTNTGGTTTASPITRTTPSDQGASSKKEMSAAIGRRDFGRAFELAEPLARDGDRDAQYALAVILDRGLNGTKNEAQAADYYLKAAQQGHAKAAFNLAAMYETGRGVDKKSDEQAFNWYLKAAELGDVDATYSVGTLYQTGTGVAKSNERAFDWYLKAAKLGDANGQNSVGVFYTLGKGTTQSDSEAVYWFRSAGEKGLAKAQKNLGDMYFYGRGVSQRDPREAFGWYKRAAEQKEPSAELAVGSYYEDGLLPVGRDYEQAAEWYRKAAEHGSAKAQTALASLKSRGVIKDN